MGVEKKTYLGMHGHRKQEINIISENSDVKSNIPKYINGYILCFFSPQFLTVDLIKCLWHAISSNYPKAQEL